MSAGFSQIRPETQPSQQAEGMMLEKHVGVLMYYLMLDDAIKLENQKIGFKCFWSLIHTGDQQF